jgi:hypothetical protein
VGAMTENFHTSGDFDGHKTGAGEPGVANGYRLGTAVEFARWVNRDVGD